MDSPKTSNTRRVLGDININSSINTSTPNTHHASQMANVQKGSAIKAFKPSLNGPQVVGTSKTEIQRENRQEPDTDSRAGKEVEEREIEQNAGTKEELGIQGDAETPEGREIQGKILFRDIVETIRDSSMVLSDAKQYGSASKKRCFSSVDDAPGLLCSQSLGAAHVERHGKRKSTSRIQPSTSFSESVLRSSNKKLGGHEGWNKGDELRAEDDDAPNDQEPGISRKIYQSTPRTNASPTSVSDLPCSSYASQVTVYDSLCSSSFVSTVTIDAEDTTTTIDNSQATEITIPDELPFTTTNVSTTRTSRTSKSTSLSREEIRQKSQALRLRLSLANYKVKTNQIDVPLSRLQVRSTSTSTSTLPKLPSLARIRANPSYGSTSSRTPLPGASPSMDIGRRAAVPAIILQRPSSSSRGGSIFVRKEKEREEDAHIPSSPPLPVSERDSLARRDSAISCTSFGSNGSNSSSSSGLGHAHPSTPKSHSNYNYNFNEKNKNKEINIESEVAKRKQDIMREAIGKENINVNKMRKPILESQKLGIANPPMIFHQPDMEGMGIGMVGRGERGRSPELSRKAADGLIRLSLLR